MEEMELAESQSPSVNNKGPEYSENDSPPDSNKNHGLLNRQRFIKDETVIARFGKRQQFQVSITLSSKVEIIKKFLC